MADLDPSHNIVELFWRSAKPIHLSRIFDCIREACYLASLRYEQDGLTDEQVIRQSRFTFGSYRNTLISKKLIGLNGNFQDLQVITRPVKGGGYEYIEVILAKAFALTVSSTNGPLKLPRKCQFRKQNCKVNPRVSQLSLPDPIFVDSKKESLSEQSKIIPINPNIKGNGLIVFGSTLPDPFTFAGIQIPDYDYSFVLNHIDLYRYRSSNDILFKEPNIGTSAPPIISEEKNSPLRLKDVPEQDPEREDETGSGGIGENGGDDLD